MEDIYPNLFASGISNEHINNNNNFNISFDAITESFDCLYDHMLSGARFLDDMSGLASPGLSERVGEGAEVDDHEQNSGGGDSSGMQMKPKRDRSRTLVSERKRRGHMKEKLYKLRSLVPNITKMDKASIIADAVAYLQNLQNQAKKLVEEISVLESCLMDDRVFGGGPSVMKPQGGSSSSCHCGGMIMEAIAHEVDEGRFYVKVVCDKGGDGTASSLYRAIESLGHFEMQSSHLSFDSDRFVLVVTLKVRRHGEVISASAMKLWVLDALVKEGFGFHISLMQ